MSTLVLPVQPKQPYHGFDITLENVRYRFDFEYNSRSDRYYMTLSDEDGTVIARGIKVVLNVSLLRKEADVTKPPGKLIAFDQSGAEAEAGEEDLGDRVLLLYEESS